MKKRVKKDDPLLVKINIASRLVAIIALLLIAFYLAGGFNLLRTLRQNGEQVQTSTIIVTKPETVTTTSSENISKEGTETTEEAKDPTKAIKDELVKRAKSVEEQLTYRADGKEEILYDISYGGDSDSTNPETPVLKLEIPSLGMTRDVFQGIGVSEDGEAGDYNRLFNALTVRHNQQLGASNFVIASHAHITSGSTEHSHEWFTPLLTNAAGETTSDISSFRIKKGDEIIATESSTGWKFVFKVSNIQASEKGDVYSDINYENLSAQVGKPRITLQCCLAGGFTHLVFIRGELDRIEAGDATYKP